MNEWGSGHWGVVISTVASRLQVRGFKFKFHLSLKQSYTIWYAISNPNDCLWPKKERKDKKIENIGLILVCVNLLKTTCRWLGKRTRPLLNGLACGRAFLIFKCARSPAGQSRKQDFRRRAGGFPFQTSASISTGTATPGLRNPPRVFSDTFPALFRQVGVVSLFFFGESWYSLSGFI